VLWILLAIFAVIALSGTAFGTSTGTGFSFGPIGTFPNSTGVTVTNSDGSLTGAQITNDPNTWPGDDKLWNICAAVALAEGYNRGPGFAPYDLNNPGDLGPGDEAGEETAGGAQWHGGSMIIVFSFAEGGWRALRMKFQHIISGLSSAYRATDSWQVVASKYAGNSANWLTNVTGYLGVDVNSTPAQYVNS
jgi:hypothetical protein